MAIEEKRILAHNLDMGGSTTSFEKVEEDEDDFRSCCEDEDELKEKEAHVNVGLDENLVKLYFKGVSIICPGDSGSKISGIGVVMERPGCSTPVQVQKKLDFYVDELVAEYLALLDALSVAIQQDSKPVIAFTDSVILHSQIVHDKAVESPLLVALRQRIMEQARKIETFVLKLVPSNDLKKALSLAQVAVGIVSSVSDREESSESCSICCEEKLSSMILTFKCTHKFCSHCMKTYVEGKVHCSQVPIRCPQLGCSYCIPASQCSLFLPVTSYKSLERALAEKIVLYSNKILCPYPSCSVPFDPHVCSSTRIITYSSLDSSCVECPVCKRSVCVDYGVPWRSSITCNDYQNLMSEERGTTDLTFHRPSRNKRWRRCDQCRRMIELSHGRYHMMCRCGRVFCYSCGVGYTNGQQTCQCAFWYDHCSEEIEAYPTQQLEQWAWDSFESLPVTMDAYSDHERSQLALFEPLPMTMDAYSDHERSQLALIQSFLAGGFSLNEQNPYQPPPPRTDSYADAMKDLHQLPWLERFVSVISDNYYEGYIQ